MGRYARKRDANERDIIVALEEAGCLVMQEQNIDLYVLNPNTGFWMPMEVKGKRGKLTPYQMKLHAYTQEAHGYTIPIVTTIEEALSKLTIEN